MTGPSAGTPSSTGMAPNVAAALSYLLWIVTGVVFFVLEKENSFVRFHAMQSILVSAALIVLGVVLSVIAMIPVLGWIIALIVYPIVGLLCLILWLMLMFRAFSGHEWELPIIGKYARQYSGGAAAI